MNKLKSTTLVGSALYGFVGLGDQIAPYRLSGDAVLPNISSLSAFWQPKLKDLIDANAELVIDLRSSMYLKLGPVPGALTPRILERVPNGPPKVVSHFNKAAKGRLTRAIVCAKKQPKTVQDVAQIAASLGWDVELAEPSKVNGSYRLDCIVDSVH